MHKIILGRFLVIAGIVSVLVTNFKVDIHKFSFSASRNKGKVTKNINKNYQLTKSIDPKETKSEKEIKELTKKVTYLLLGDANNVNESSEDYYKRHKEYLAMRYAPDVKEDPTTFTGLDEDSEEYKDDNYTGLTIPAMFKIFDDLKVVYGSFGNIRVAESDKFMMSLIQLPNVTISEANKKQPMKYDRVKTNLTITYFFKELKGEYKLYSIFGELDDSLEGYFSEVEDTETSNTMQMAPAYNSELNNIYDFSKLEGVTQQQVNTIENNKENILTFSSYYNNNVVASANGFYIGDGLVVTTWTFLKESLMEAQYMAGLDNNGNVRKIEGIVVTNPEADIAVLKMDKGGNTKIVLGESSSLKVEDPVFAISSKTGVGLTAQGGIVVSNNGYIESTIPLVKNDEGSPLVNIEGQVVGMNTAKQVNASISLAVTTEVLKEIEDKFGKLEYKDIKSITFDKLKEDYYYVKHNKEKIKKDIPKDKWKEYSKIGNIEKNISLKLLKSSYQDNVISLRYYNAAPEYIDNMQLSVGFRQQLKKDGYKQMLYSPSKCVYQNKEYKVIIMSEFNYLIVVMVKL